MSSVIPKRARHPVELAALVSGYQIIAESDPRLEVWSSVRFPRKGERTCLIHYQPDHAKYLDYVIAHECGHIYRFFSAEPKDRLVPVTDELQLRQATDQVARESRNLRKKIPSHLLRNFLTSLCFGLVRQLTNTPADCRIETWIYENFEELRDMQASAVGELLSFSAQALSPRVKDWTPASVYEKSNTMNYVLAKSISRLLREPRLLAAYADQVFVCTGEKLSPYVEEPDCGYVDDIRIADAWAQELGLADWYSWRSL